MQAYDQSNEVFKSFFGEKDQLEAIGKKMVEMKSASRFVIGELPEEGSEVEINGLKFYVYSRTEGGTVVLKLKKIK